MQIICISRGSFGFSSDIAEQLAAKIGYTCISREMLTEKAADYGIPVGKVEIEVLKKRPLSEALNLEVERYKAFMAKELCEKAGETGVVYHGRAGHLVLPGLSNVMRVRAIADMNMRIEMAMTRLNLDWKRAKNYIEQTDEDIRRWISTLYHEDWENPALYDVTVNAARISSGSAAHSLMQLAQLPEFQQTPSSQKGLEDLLLASLCRLELSRNESTRHVNVSLTADNGHVSATYLPRQSKESKEIAHVLESMKEVKSYVCTVASTNILCVGDSFDHTAGYFAHLINVAEKWNAAVEIVRMASDEEIESHTTTPSVPLNSNANGGILDETEGLEWAVNSNHGVQETMNHLVQVGRAGSSHTTYGGVNGLIADISKNKSYSMIVVDNIFSSKGVAQQRLKRDLMSLLTDKFRIPVLSADDLKDRYLFGTKQMISLLGFAFLSILLYLLVFKFQSPIISFISAGQFSGDLNRKIAASAVVATCIPLIASIIGGFYHNLLKLIRLE